MYSSEGTFTEVNRGYLSRGYYIVNVLVGIDSEASPCITHSNKPATFVLAGQAAFRVNVREHFVSYKYGVRATNEEGRDASQRYRGVLLPTLES